MSEYVEIQFADYMYKIKPKIKLSMVDEFYNKIMESDNSRDNIIFLLYMMLEQEYNDCNLPNFSELNKINDDELYKFIEAIVQQDKNGFFLEYDLIKTDGNYSSIFDMFCNSFEKSYKLMKESLSNKLKPLYERWREMNKSLTIYNQNIQQYNDIIKQWIKHKNLYVQRLEMNKAFIIYSQNIQHYNNIIKQWNKKISSILKPLANGTFVEKYKSSFEQWGQYGWTIIDRAPFSIYYQIPQTQIEADKIVLKYLKEQDLELLFKDLYTYKIKKIEIDEAIKCFNTSCYKACAMIVISMIEQKLIKFQDVNGNYSKKFVGRGAVNRLHEYITNSDELDEKSIKYLLFCNTTAYLTKLFENANDFMKEPDLLNRNFIMHGMSKRRVRRKDCIKLFLALKNFLLLSEFYNIKC